MSEFTSMREKALVVTAATAILLGGTACTGEGVNGSDPSSESTSLEPPEAQNNGEPSTPENCNFMYDPDNNKDTINRGQAVVVFRGAIVTGSDEIIVRPLLQEHDGQQVYRDLQPVTDGDPVLGGVYPVDEVKSYLVTQQVLNSDERREVVKDADGCDVDSRDEHRLPDAHQAVYSEGGKVIFKGSVFTSFLPPNDVSLGEVSNLEELYTGNIGGVFGGSLPEDVSVDDFLIERN